MSKRAEKALDRSIAHWERLASGNRREGEDIGYDYCALCKLYIDDECVTCPIYKFTGSFGCLNTPYNAAYDTADFYGLDSKEFKKEARKELRFLKKVKAKLFGG